VNPPVVLMSPAARGRGLKLETTWRVMDKARRPPRAGVD